MNLRKQLIFLFGIFISAFCTAQITPKSVTARYIDAPINLDGVLDEAVWETAEVAGDFRQFFPSDQVSAEYPTEVKVLFSDTHLYLGIYAKKAPGDYVVSTLKRDFGALTNDNISLLFDTFSDGTTAYFFGVTPYGVRREGLVSEGGSNFNNTWDIKWQAEATRFDDHFVIEIAIPFTSLKFVEGATKWRFRPYRWNNQSNQQDTWVKVPQQQLLSSLADMGELRFERPLGKSRTPIALIPYVNALADKDYASDVSETSFKTGGDAKIAVGNGMNLDLTLNPDFSNVEVDDIFTNLTRFEVRLPEKRQFFIDNSDLFESFGNTFNEAKPFFSRRIGLARNAEGNLIQNDIIGGARLSGKLNNDWRLGFLNLQTARDEANEIASYNNMMLAVQRKVGTRSNIGVFWVNRQAVGDEDYLNPAENYNRVIGADYNLASSDNVWNGKLYLHKSFQPGDSEGNFSSQATVTYNPRRWRIIQDLVYIDQDFRADLGFVPRRDVFKWGNGIQRIFYPKTGIFNTHGVRLLSITYWRPSLDYKKTDHNYSLNWETAFRNQASAEVTFRNNYIFLVSPFDPTRTNGATPLPGNQGYHFNQVSLEYQSNNTKVITYSANATLGRFFNGEITSVGGQLGFRVQPKAAFSLGFNYDGIRLPEPYADANIFFATFRADLTFSKSLFWNTLVQYSNRQENLGINSRLQWRFAPLSDLYLVYNDNYFTGTFGPRFRSINLKLTYWLNI
ncbi:MAG: carbohydrate binding family 9 domain-containing protein [Maribacter sp.]|nr:carbohydrate binding family 9 domain-containing protein [Maribacter sp.]